MILGYFKWDRVSDINRATPQDVVKVLKLKGSDDLWFIIQNGKPYVHIITNDEQEVIAQLSIMQQGEKTNEQTNI